MNDEIEIDIRKYILLLLKRWWLIVTAAALFAIVAFVLTSFTPVSYQATALVAVTQPLYQLNFDPKIQTINVQPANKVYLDIATSDDVLKQVFDQWTDRPASIKDVGTFRDKVISVGSGSDLSIIKLNATTNNPDQSANVANLWAKALTERANAIYFGQDQQLKFLEDQMNNAQSELDLAEKALIDFQAQNQLQIMTNQLNSLLQNQRDYLTIQRNILYLSQSLQGFRSQLSSSPGNQTTIADQLNALLLQFQTFNSQTMSGVNTIPLQIQFTDATVFGGLDNRAQISILDNLDTIIQNRYTKVTGELQALNPQILNLQQSVQQYQVNQDQLQRAQDIAQDTYTSLVNKVNEVTIADQDPTNRLQLASTALPPSEPLPRNRIRNTLLAGVVGGILALTVILIWVWWRDRANPEL